LAEGIEAEQADVGTTASRRSPRKPFALQRRPRRSKRHFEGQYREIEMGNRLYVGNLSFGSSEQSLRDAFSPHGEVVDVHLVSDRMTGQSRGFGFVTMGSREQAESAMSAMNGADLDGRSLKVNEAEERSGGAGGGGGARRGGGGGGGRGGGGGGGRW
jgi:RNA recognition motif-containing protein